MAHRCAYCGKYFRKRSNMTSHIASVHNDLMIVCGHCEMSFDCKESRIHHILQTHKPDDDTAFYFCTYCPRTFVKARCLRDHNKVNHQGKKPECSRCGKKFRSLRGHSQHERVHCPILKKELVEASNKIGLLSVSRKDVDKPSLDFKPALQSREPDSLASVTVEELCQIVKPLDFQYTLDSVGFRRTPSTTFLSQETRGNTGIQQLTSYFSTFDPMNTVGRFNVWTNYRYPTDLEINHAYSYLIAPEFSKTLLQTTGNDCVVNALISFLLHWTNKGLLDFGKTYPIYNALVISVLEEKDRFPVYSTIDGVPFVRSSFTILTHYFKSVDELQRKAMGYSELERPLFCINYYVEPQMIAHFKDVYAWLMNESITKQEINHLEEKWNSPLSSATTHYLGAGTTKKSVARVITGQSCCGKTILLDILKTKGWLTFSRSDLGGFSTEHNPSLPATTGLHAAFENAMSRGDVVANRGPVDLQLWTIMTTLVDLKYKDFVVEELMNFFNGVLNEHVLAYMSRQKVVVLIDPYPSLNRQRMLMRCKGDDATLARIHMYPVIQCIAFYVAARLYGWLVRCVPYDSERNFQPHQYQSLAEEVMELFGEPSPQQPIGPASKPNGHYVEDKEFATSAYMLK